MRVSVPVSASSAVRVSVFNQRSHFRRAKVGVKDAGHDHVEGDAATGRQQHRVGVDLKVFVDDSLDRQEDQHARQQPNHHDGEQSA